MSDIKQISIDKHKQLAGKLKVVSKGSVDNMNDLAIYYSPGVGAVSALLGEQPELMRQYTGTNNSVAIISDGSAVLGLGNIGPQGAMPVMEGKAMLFNRFAGIDGYPVVLNTQDTEEIIATIKAISPSYGAINIEDISAPRCFEIEKRLKAELDMPVMHDDQHGTAVVVLAGLINATKVVDKNLDDCKVVVSGVGAAGVAIMKLLKLYSPSIVITAVDSRGIIINGRDGLNPTKQGLLDDNTINSANSGDLAAAVKDADIFIGVSLAGLLKPAMVKTMASNAIIFALANPDPEILPEDALAAGAAVVATGRSDYPNQVNNAVAFPGIFRGALDNQVKAITDDHKLAAAKVIAGLVETPTSTEVIPDVFDKRLVPAIAKIIV